MLVMLSISSYGLCDYFAQAAATDISIPEIPENKVPIDGDEGQEKGRPSNEPTDIQQANTDRTTASQIYYRSINKGSQVESSWANHKISSALPYVNRWR